MSFEKYIVFLQAGIRLSPLMMLFMLRRLARNRLAVRLPRWYQKRLQTIIRTVPEIASHSSVSDAVREVGEFYCAEYGDQIDEVLKGKIQLHGRTVDFEAPENVNWKVKIPEEGDHQMWPVKLGHMGFLCPMLINGGAPHHQAVMKLISSFRKNTSVSDRGAFNSYWFPYGASHRVLALTSGYLIARESSPLPLELDLEIKDFLRENVAFILDNIEHELENNHVERNLAALCLYFTHVEKVPPSVARRLEKDVSHLVEMTILPDGGQIERSPMYQGLSIVSQHVMVATPFLSRDLRQLLHNNLDKARTAFSILCHPDGKVALFNDSWHHEVPAWAGPVAPDGRSLLVDLGYARLSEGRDLCLLDAGALGPRWNPGHGHADFLSVEITLAGERLIVDPGTSRYNTGAERARERSAEAHNGPIWKGYEPVEFLGCFKVGRMAEAVLLPTEDLPELTIGGLFHDGPGTMARAVRHYPGKGFLVADVWSENSVQGQVCWLIPAHWTSKRTDSGISIKHKQSGVLSVLQSLAGNKNIEITRSQWAHQYGRCEEATQVRVQALQTKEFQFLLHWIGLIEAEDEIHSDGVELTQKLITLVEKNGKSRSRNVC